MREEYDWDRGEAELADVPQPGLSSTLPRPSLSAGEDLTRFELTEPELNFGDVIGLESTKDRLRAVFLEPFRASEPGERSFSSRVLLYGPPGCGKTTLARAIAGELSVPLLRASGAQLLDLYAGESEEALRSLFDVARDNAPCALFLDELDTIEEDLSTKARAPWSRTVIRQLLHELETLERAGLPVAVIAATTRPWVIDSLFRIAGDLEHAVLVRPPDEGERRRFLERGLGAHAALDRLAERSDGYSGADILRACAAAGPRATAQEVELALSEMPRSVAEWRAEAKQAADRAPQLGALDDLRSYLESA